MCSSDLYDGILGTLAGLELVRTLNDAGIETELPICICNWTNEEGSRFAPAMMASAAYVGDFTTDDILSRKDAEGVTVAQALDSIGYRGDAPVGRQKFSGFVELHIEQGTVLEGSGTDLGLVTAIAGIERTSDRRRCRARTAPTRRKLRASAWDAADGPRR